VRNSAVLALFSASLSLSGSIALAQSSSQDSGATVPVPPAMQEMLQQTAAGTAEKAVPPSFTALFDDFSTDLIDGKGERGVIKSVGQALGNSYQTQIDPQTRKSIWNVQVRPMINRAQVIESKVQHALFDKSLSDAQKLALFQSYMQKVLYPLRELVVMAWDDDFPPQSTDPMDGLLPNVPSQLVSTKETKAVAERGTDPNNPLGLLIQEFPQEIQACKGQARAVFDTNPLNTLMRDIRSFRHVVTADTYVRAIKQMAVQMLVGQIRQFDTFINSEEPARDAHGNYLPDRVQKSHINLDGCQSSIGGGLPKELDLDLPPYAAPGGRLDQMDMMLVANGLLLGKGGQQPFRDMFVGDVHANPEEGNFSGYVPFEEIRAADRGLNPSKRHPSPYKRAKMEPAIDDESQFQRVLKIEMPKIEAAYGAKPAGLQDVQDILEIVPSDLSVGYGANAYTKPTAGLSKYLVNLMKEVDADTWEEAVPRIVKGKLMANTVVHAMPPLDSPDAARRWGLAEIASFAEKYKNTNDKTVLDLVAKSCPKATSKGKGVFCAKGGGGVKEWLSYLADKLAPFSESSRYLPRTDFQDQKLREIYPNLMELWGDLAPFNNRFIDASQSEWDYIRATIKTNPWASIRLSYEIASLRTKPAGAHNPIRPLGEILGVDKPLDLFHANKILSKSEKNSLWEDVVKEGENANGHIFGTKLPGSNKPLFEEMTEINALPPLLTRQSAIDAVKKYMPPDQVAPALRKIDEYWSDTKPKAAAQDEGPNEFSLAENLIKIYDAKPNSPEQTALVQKQIKEAGLESLDEVRAQFLAVDGEHKRLIYHELIREAAQQKRDKTQALLQRLCHMKPNDTQGFKEIIRSTVAAQDDLNKQLGLPGLPPDVQERLDAWLPRDKSSLKLAGLQFVTFAMGASLAAACTVATAGGCAPIATALLYTASTAAGLAILNNSVMSKQDANARMARVQDFADAGLTTSEAVQEAGEGYAGLMGYTNIVLDGLGSVTPVKGALLSWEMAGSASKMAFLEGAHAVEDNRGMRTLLWKGLAGGKKLAGRTAEDLGILAGRLPSSEYGELMASAIHEHDLARSARILGMATRGEAVLKAARPELIKDATASYGKTLSKEFGNDIERFRGFLQRNVGDRLETIEAKLRDIDNLYSDPEKLGVIRTQLKKLGVPERKIDKLTRRLYYGKRIGQISDELRALEASHGDLDKYISDNANDLSEILNNIPGTWMDVPYNFVLDGSPFLGRRIAGTALRTPAAILSDSYVAKRASAAFEGVVYHAYRDEALKTLGRGNDFKPIHNTYEAVQEFMSVAQSLPDKTVRNDMASMQLDMAKKVYQYQKLGPAHVPSLSEFTRILWAPKSPYEEMIAAGWWNTTPPDRMFADFKTFKSPARTVEWLGKTYKETGDVQDFENYLTAFKLLVYAKDPAALPH
jgi:hypothetical protein